MSSKVIQIQNTEQIDELIRQVDDNCDYTMKRLLQQGSQNSLTTFYEMKFGKIGRDPLADRDLNIIEQLNQTYTYLVSFYAVRYLLKHYSEQAPFIMNLGTSAGNDIYSEDGKIIAEVFSATSVSSNNKIRKDIEKLQQAEEECLKFVFYHTPKDETVTVNNLQVKYPEIQIVRLELD